MHTDTHPILTASLALHCQSLTSICKSFFEFPNDLTKRCRALKTIPLIWGGLETKVDRSSSIVSSSKGCSNTGGRRWSRERDWWLVVLSCKQFRLPMEQLVQEVAFIGFGIPEWLTIQTLSIDMDHLAPSLTGLTGLRRCHQVTKDQRKR